MIDDACESIREKAKLMKGLFGNTDENSRNVDKLEDSIDRTYGPTEYEINTTLTLSYKILDII
ncbi:unnamed protein product [Brassica napus]|uniref:(rape) hypothetical protein n=1 Tax=Brassica napus TaxID=3708 RepID=A0A816ZQK6_BRANA|nr:unnamed protein product [Brassica napus]